MVKHANNFIVACVKLYSVDWSCEVRECNALFLYCWSQSYNIVSVIASYDFSCTTQRTKAIVYQSWTQVFITTDGRFAIEEHFRQLLRNLELLFRWAKILFLVQEFGTFNAKWVISHKKSTSARMLGFQMWSVQQEIGHSEYDSLVQWVKFKLSNLAL